MISNLEYVELNESNVSKEVLKKFDCGHNDISNYLFEDAYIDCNEGNGVTYILVSKNDYKNNSINYIYAYATIRTYALNYYESAKKYCTKYADENGNVLSCIPSVEVKLFAIEKAFQGKKPVNNDHCYSTIFFKFLLEKLYYMSMNTIGFKTIFLRANKNGENLYRGLYFKDCTEYMDTYDEIAEGCKPLFLPLIKLEYVLFS